MNDQIPTHQYETTEGTEPTPYAEHEPRTIAHTTQVVDDTDLTMMTEIGDGTFVEWATCRRCNHRIGSCTCPDGPQEPPYMTKWRGDRFVKELNQRPEPELPLLEPVLGWARERGYIVAKAGEVDALFIQLFKAVADCEAPAGTQLDDVLHDFQEAYCNLLGLPVPQFCWECREDGENTEVDGSLADDNGPLCEGCYERRVEDGLIVPEQICAECDATVPSTGPMVSGQHAESCSLHPSNNIAPEQDFLSDLPQQADADGLPTEDDMAFARETLGPDATESEVTDLAGQRAERDLKEFDVDF